jgi:molybdopterin-binding protein
LAATISNLWLQSFRPRDNPFLPAADFRHPIRQNQNKELPVKISARNQLKGTIVDVETVDELELAKGKAAVAVIKASDVMVGVD